MIRGEPRSGLPRRAERYYNPGRRSLPFKAPVGGRSRHSKPQEHSSSDTVCTPSKVQVNQSPSLLHLVNCAPSGLDAQNLSTLSTSAPAPSVRVDPSASRRGTCDRGICTKPLARRTRGSYGFCMRDSRFVRRRVGLSGLVKHVGRSGGRCEEAIRCG